MEPSKKKPSSFGKIDLGYDPGSMEMQHDPYFADIAPGVVSSGDLAHKWSIDGDHTYREEPPNNLSGD